MKQKKIVHDLLYRGCVRWYNTASMVDKETKLGGLTATAGAGWMALSTLESLSNQRSLTQEQVKDIIDDLPIQESIKTFIPRHMWRYLDGGDLGKISQMARRCQETQPESRLIFWGFPTYNNSNQLTDFIPMAVGCGSVNQTRPIAEGAQDVIIQAPDVIYQINLISQGLQKNTLALDPSFRESDAVTDIFSDSIDVKLPLYQIRDNGSIELVRFQQVEAVEHLSTDKEFIYNTLKEYELSGICSFPSDPQNRIHSTDHRQIFTGNDGKGVVVNICETQVRRSTGPIEVNFWMLPREIQRQMFQAYSIPDLNIAPGTNGKIELHVPDGRGGSGTITIYSPGSISEPGYSSEIMAYRESELRIGKPGSFHITYGMLGGGLTLALGLAMIGHGLKKMRRTPRFRPSASERKREFVRQPAQPRPEITSRNGSGFVMAETRPATTPFILDFGDQSVLITHPQDEVLPKLQGLTQNDQIKKRLRKNREDFIEFFSAISKYRGDFSATHALVENRQRFSEIHIGGDSVTVSYKISEGNEILGWLLIDANVEVNEVLVELWDEEPKIPAIREKRRSEAAASVVQTEYTQYTVDQIADEIAGNADYEKLQQYRNDSRVKKEVIRRISEKITSNQIPVYERGVKGKNTYKEYARIIAARLYDYISGEAPTSAEEFEAFTQSAKSLLDQMELEVLPQTAAKSWATRTGFRIQIVQTVDQGITIVFTGHGH